jgi:hypothetical protein
VLAKGFGAGNCQVIVVAGTALEDRQCSGHYKS